MELQAIIDDKGFHALVDRLKGNISNLTPGMRLVGQFVAESIDDTFQAEGRPEPWAPLAASTVAHKSAGKKILEGATRRLRGGIHVEDVGHNTVTVAPDELPYARIHHLGSRPGSRQNIPARPYLLLQSGDAGEIADILADFIVRSSL